MSDEEPGSTQLDAPGSGSADLPPYHPPLLRSHGSLRDLTAQMSGVLAGSDVNSKENIVAVAWP